MKKSKLVLFKPRLSIYKSNKHIYAQIIDDVNGNTIISCSSLDLEIKRNINKLKCNNCIVCHLIGIKIGIQLKDENIFNVFLDKNVRFTSKVKSLIDGIRLQGINI